jgi:hypothetical protein
MGFDIESANANAKKLLLNVDLSIEDTIGLLIDLSSASSKILLLRLATLAMAMLTVIRWIDVFRAILVHDFHSNSDGCLFLISFFMSVCVSSYYPKAEGGHFMSSS